VQEAPAGALRSAVAATYIAFVGSGFAFSSWASRIPQVRQHFHLDPFHLGLLLLAISSGSMVSLPLSGSAVSRFGSSRAVSVASLLLGIGLGITAVGDLVSLGLVAAGLFLVGFANGAWDVAMNVQAAGVERRLGRSIMPRFHAGFSIGTVAGAAVGVVAVALRVPVSIHLAVVAVVTTALVSTSAVRFLPDHGAVTAGSVEASAATPLDEDGVGSPGGDAGAGADLQPDSAPRRRRGGSRSAWRERRTLQIGFFVLAFALAEGSGNDWISVSTIAAYRVPAVIGTLAYAAFVAAMTAGRWFGPAFLDRRGRVVVSRALALAGVAGLALFIFGHVIALAFAGVLLWGLGASLGFPIGMSAGSDEEALAPRRVSVIASIAYCAFLAGPPVIGLLGNHLRLPRSLGVVALLLLVAFVLAPATRPLSATATVEAKRPEPVPPGRAAG
jgi:predicted MFS family arabinose efflux permease